jgi:hypothetical protein
VVEEVKVSPADLVMLAYREVECDDTLREFKQVLRFDLVDAKGQPLRAQLLLDRRHKLNRALSKPVAYFRMSTTEQLVKLANTALAVAVALAYNEQQQLSPSLENVKATVNAHWSMARVDVVNAVELMLRDLQLHQMVQAKLAGEAAAT